MDINTYALEMLAKDRLARARAEAAASRLLAGDETRAPRVPVRVGLGLALIAFGRWLRAAEPRGVCWSGVRGDCGSGVVGDRLGPQVA